eukprot:TRINITY_DN10350_c0_g1_i5.p1 TRINITY_DN10350_c0_g1~~TRINITY_DN10350_c0_g1_i5.p1  ORF type:complete len:636 (+),score=152.05 TRINITY_DN10350_c0_g1_i5:382-2289(+)
MEQHVQQANLTPATGGSSSAISPCTTKATLDSGLPSANTSQLPDDESHVSMQASEGPAEAIMPTGNNAMQASPDDEMYHSFNGDETAELSDQLHSTRLTKPQAIPGLVKVLAEHEAQLEQRESGGWKVTVPVRSEDCSRLIGHQGVRMRELQARSDAKIEVKEATTDGQSTVECCGTIAQAQRAALLVLQQVSQRQDDHSLEAAIDLALQQLQPSALTHRLRVPHVAVPYLSANNKHVLRNIHKLADCTLELTPPSSPEHQHQDGSWLLQLHGRQEQVDYAMQLLQIRLTPMAEGGAMGVPLVISARPRSGNPCIRLHVRDDVIGRIMGRGGGTVQQLQQAHNIYINIPKQRIKGTHVREIWLEGPLEALQACYAAILELLEPQGQQPLLTCMSIPPAWQEFTMVDIQGHSPRNHRRHIAPSLTPRSTGTPRRSRRSQTSTPRPLVTSPMLGYKYPGGLPATQHGVMQAGQMYHGMPATPGSVMFHSPSSYIPAPTYSPIAIRGPSPVTFSHTLSQTPLYTHMQPMLPATPVCVPMSISQAMWQTLVSTGHVAQVQQQCAVHIGESSPTLIQQTGIVNANIVLTGMDANVREACQRLVLLQTQVPVMTDLGDRSMFYPRATMVEQTSSPSPTGND